MSGVSCVWGGRGGGSSSSRRAEAPKRGLVVKSDSSYIDMWWGVGEAHLWSKGAARSLPLFSLQRCKGCNSSVSGDGIKSVCLVWHHSPTHPQPAGTFVLQIKRKTKKKNKVDDKVGPPQKYVPSSRTGPRGRALEDGPTVHIECASIKRQRTVGNSRYAQGSTYKMETTSRETVKASQRRGLGCCADRASPLIPSGTHSKALKQHC